jgi:hypothetical protein
MERLNYGGAVKWGDERREWCLFREQMEREGGKEIANVCKK